MERNRILCALLPALAAGEDSKMGMLLPVLEKLRELMSVGWWIGGGILLIGIVCSAVYILRRTRVRPPRQKGPHESKPI